MKRIVFVITLLTVTLLPLLALADRREGARIPEFRKVENINIYGHLKEGEKPKVYPASIYLDRGAAVLWSNGSDTSVRIKFGKGTKCTPVSQTQVLDYAWATMPACIVTEPALSPKTVLEIFFTEPGPYDWEIEFVGTDQRLSGNLKVF